MIFNIELTHLGLDLQIFQIFYTNYNQGSEQEPKLFDLTFDNTVWEQKDLVLFTSLKRRRWWRRKKKMKKEEVRKKIKRKRIRRKNNKDRKKNE